MENIIDYQTKLIHTFTHKWTERAQVRKTYYPYERVELDVEKPDFLTELLPFSQHPLWNKADAFLKKRVNSLGWILYNKKTIHIETEIVMPVCDDIVHGNFAVLEDDHFKQLASQAMIDESYHTLLSVKGCALISEFRCLPKITLPAFQLITQLKKELFAASSWQQTLIRLAAAISSELLVSDYLISLSNSTEIQPFCRALTEAHWRDEMSHAGIFTLLTRKIFPALNPGDQAFLIEVIMRCSTWFNDKESACWLSILNYLEFPDAETMLFECNLPNNNLNKNKLNHLIQSLALTTQGETRHDHSFSI